MKTFITKNKFKTRIFYKDYKMNICSIIFLVFLIATELMVLLGIDSGVYDEVIAIFGFFFILLGMIKKDNISTIIFILNVFLFISGLIPFLYNSYERGFALKIMDFFLTFKFIFWLFGFRIFFKIFRGKIQFARILKIHNLFSILVISFLTIFESYSYFVDGIERVSLTSGFNGSLANLILVFQISSLVQTLFFNKKNLLNCFIFNLFCFYNIFLTNSSTCIILSTLIFMTFLVFYFKIKLRFIAIPLILIILLFAYIFRDKIELYFFSEDTARSVLYWNSVNLAISYFPLGIGLSLYGTTIAGQYYSPLYVDLKFTEIYGLEKNGDYLNDAFYPGIVGEFGLFGVLCLLFYFALIFLMFYKRKDKNSLFFIFSLIITLLALNISFNFINSLTTLLLFAILYLIYYLNYNTILLKRTFSKQS